MADMFIDDSRLDSIIDEILPNLTMIYPNITKEWIYDNNDIFMYWPKSWKLWILRFLLHREILKEMNATRLIELIEGSIMDNLMDQMQVFSVYYASEAKSVYG